MLEPWLVVLRDCNFASLCIQVGRNHMIYPDQHGPILQQIPDKRAVKMAARWWVCLIIEK